jgi:hypothetical protein
MDDGDKAERVTRVGWLQRSMLSSSLLGAIFLRSARMTSTRVAQVTAASVEIGALFPLLLGRPNPELIESVHPFFVQIIDWSQECLLGHAGFF